jgi:hypothetical protein
MFEVYWRYVKEKTASKSEKVEKKAEPGAENSLSDT